MYNPAKNIFAFYKQDVSKGAKHWVTHEVLNNIKWAGTAAVIEFARTVNFALSQTIFYE